MDEFRCVECAKNFKTEDALNMHNKSKHAKAYIAPAKPRFRKLRKYLILVVIVTIAVSGYYFLFAPPENAPILLITPSAHNFGAVSQAGGTVNAVIQLRNNGLSDLVINGLDTSCGCTSASVVKDGVEGPMFSMAMHGTNPTDWQQVIPPGESAELKIYYNPNVHPTLRGAVTRSVFVMSNDPRDSKKEVRINAVQTD